MSRRKEPAKTICPSCGLRVEAMRIGDYLYCEKCGVAMGHVLYETEHNHVS